MDIIVIQASLVPFILLTCFSLWYCPSHVSRGLRCSSSSSCKCRLPWAFSSWAHRRCTFKQHSRCSRSFFNNSHWAWTSNDRKYVWNIPCLHLVSALNCLTLTLRWCHDMIRLLICFYFHACELISQALILGLQCCQLFLLLDALLLPLYRQPVIFLQGQTRMFILHPPVDGSKRTNNKRNGT